MKKLSKLIESIWSDIQDRSAGEIERKEDNVDFLEPDDFVAHIRKIYKFDNTPYDIENRTNTGTEVPNIFIPICTAGIKNTKLGVIYFDYNGGVVYTHSSIKKYIPKLWAKLDQDFNLLDGNGLTYINPKDTSRKVNNSYVLELLNYICNNLDDTVKPCLFRRTNESIWSDIQDRSAGEVIRDEDKFNPDYVDFGDNTTVYWAIDNLEIDGEVKFHFDDVKDYNNNGWRLPTVDEVNQLNWSIRITWYEGYNHLKFIDGNELRIKTNSAGGGFHMWTKEINTKFPTGAYAYGFDNSNVFDVGSFNKSMNRLLVFLVKDKKVTESLWSDIQDRSSGDVIRREDDLTNLKDLVPVDIGVSVLWADKDLETVDGDYNFKYDDEYNLVNTKSGWRLPTKEEADELFNNVTVLKNTNEKYIIQGKNSVQLVFLKRGFTFADGSHAIIKKYTFDSWTSTPVQKDIYTAIHIEKKYWSSSFNCEHKLCIRLVKDK